MKAISIYITVLVALLLAFGASSCDSGDGSKPVEPSLTLPLSTVELSDVNYYHVVVLDSSVDWTLDLGAATHTHQEVELPNVVEMEWLRISPAHGNPGSNGVTIRLIQEKKPTKASSMDINFMTKGGEVSKTLTVKYQPK